MRFLSRCVPALIVAIVFGAAPAWAGITGSISGVVTHPSGAVIIDATVTAAETPTGIRSEITTDSKGALPAFPTFPCSLSFRME